MKQLNIIATTDRGLALGKELHKEIPESGLVTTRESSDNQVSQTSQISQVDSLPGFLQNHFHQSEALIFITSLGACVRLIAPFLQDKATDPAVICMDDHGRFVQSVVGGHQAGANNLALKVSKVFGAQAVISTSGDLQGLWALDTLGGQFGWHTEFSTDAHAIISAFVNNEPTALLLEVNTRGTRHLEATVPGFVEVFYDAKEIDFQKFKLLLAVTYKGHEPKIPSVFYYPKVLSIGSGCSKELHPALFAQQLQEQLIAQQLSFHAVKSIGSIDLKKDQEAYLKFSSDSGIPFHTFSKEEINTVEAPNPSEVVQSKIGVEGVSESVAMLLSGNPELLVEKHKLKLNNGNKFTYAIALDRVVERKPSIAIVGAGPGDEELISLKGKKLLEQADCVLYAGSLIPEEMISWCKAGAVVRSSASMTLEAQMALMQEHYRKGHKIVRLHSGDPSIYGAIQEQMTLFDELEMAYFIVPGISSFNAAAAVLKSEFTIPEVVQTIIITRGEGKTPLPPHEKLEEMAKLRATICLFLSTHIARKVQEQMLKYYEPDTPVAVLYRLTWKDEEVYTGILQDLSDLVKKSKKTRTVLIVVGHAIHARKNRSQLYSPGWKHIFRREKC